MLSRALIWTLIVCMCCTGVSIAQCVDYHDYVHWIAGVETAGDAYDVSIAGQYAYVTASSCLQIIDISNPGDPQPVSQVDMPGYAGYLAVSGNYVYVTGEFSLQVVDISDPFNPWLASSIITVAQAHCVTVSGGYAYLAAPDAGLLIYDISNPLSPFLRRKIVTSGEPYGVTVADNFAYIADGTYGFSVYDLTDLVFPKQVYNYGTADYDIDVVKMDDYVYVGGKTGVHVFDFSDPEYPIRVNFGATYDAINSLAVVDDHLYASTSGRQLFIFDVSNPWQPLSVARIQKPWDTRGVAVSGDCFFVANMSGGLQIHDVATKAELQAIGRFAHGSANLDFGNLAIDGSMAYVAFIGEYVSGVGVFDISDPANPLNIDYLTTMLEPTALAVVDNYLYVGDDMIGLRIFNIEDPENIRYVTTLTSLARVLDIDIRDEYAYVVDRYKGLQILDLADPEAPGFAGVFDPTADVLAVTLSGHYAFLSVAYVGLQVIDISDPEFPVMMKIMDQRLWSRDVACSGNHVYMFDSSELLSIDVVDPINPVVMNSLPLAGYPDLIVARGNRIYIGNSSAGMVILDITDPVAPVPGGEADVPINEATGIFVSDDYLLVASGPEFVILPAPCPDAVPAFLSEFSVGTDAMSVKASWCLGVESEDPVFRLTAKHEMREWDVPYLRTREGLYVAEDLSANRLRPGEYTYSLYVQVEGRWSLLGEKSISLNSPFVAARLLSAFPNPFNPATTIAFELYQPGRVSLIVYDVSGRLVRNLLDERFMEPGRREVFWGGRDDAGRQVPAGVYFYRMSTQGFSDTGRAALIK